MRALERRRDVRRGGLDVCPAQAFAGGGIEVAGEVGCGETIDGRGGGVEEIVEDGGLRGNCGLYVRRGREEEEMEVEKGDLGYLVGGI